MRTRSIAIVKFTVSGIILALAGLWVFRTSQPFNALAYFMLGVLILLAGFAFYQGIKALQNEKAGLNPVDELSIRIKEKAAAKAFQFSILMWLFWLLFAIDLFPIKSEVQTKIIVALGMVGMTLIFLLTWLYYSKAGVDDENKN